MAVRANKIDTDLVLRVKVGLDKNGKDKMKNINFTKMQVDASDEDLMIIGRAIEKVLNFSVEQVIKQDKTALLNA